MELQGQSPYARQRHPRVPLETRVACRSGLTASWTSLNVSESGLFVQGTPILSPGTELDVGVLLPRGANSIEVRGRARVVWNNHPEASAPVPNHPTGMGMELVDLDAAERGVLQSHLAARGQYVTGLPTEEATLRRGSLDEDLEPSPLTVDELGEAVGVGGRLLDRLKHADLMIVVGVCVFLSGGFAVLAVLVDLPGSSIAVVPEGSPTLTPRAIDTQGAASVQDAVADPASAAVAPPVVPAELRPAGATSSVPARSTHDLLVDATYLVDGGEYGRAVQACMEVLRREPANALAHRTLAIAYSYSGELEKACGSFERYLHYEPNAPDAEQVRANLELCKE